MIDICTGTKPKLGALFTTRIHDAKVVETWPQKRALLVSVELGNTSDEILDALVLAPPARGHNLAAATAFGRVARTLSDTDASRRVEHVEELEDMRA